MENGGSVVLVEDITERKIAEARINHLARYDPLTGLPNRTFLRDQMDRALARCHRSGPCAVLFVDLDQFKQVNDTLGHPRGDICCSRSPSACAGSCAPPTSSRASAATNSSSCSLRSSGLDQAPALARRIVECLEGPTRSTDTRW